MPWALCHKSGADIWGGAKELAYLGGASRPAADIAAGVAEGTLRRRAPRGQERQRPAVRGPGRAEDREGGAGPWGPGSGLEDDSAGDAAGGLRAVRLGCLGERIHPADLGAQVALVDHAGELRQLSAGGLLDEEDRPDA